MEKITVTKVSEVKTIDYVNKKTGKPDSFQKVGFQTSEYGPRWHDLTFRGLCPIKEGNTYELDLTPREYNGKTYWDAKFPTKDSELNKAIMRHELEISKLWQAIKLLQRTDDIPVINDEDQGEVPPPSDEDYQG